MAGKIIVSTLQSDTDNSISFVANTGATIFSANLSHGIAGSFIGAGSITGDKIGATAINANNIVNASITGAKLAANTVTGDVIGQNAISSNNIVSVNASVATVGTLPAARLPAGSMLQAVQSIKTDAQVISSETKTDITGMSVTITPSSASSKILIFIALAYNTAGNANHGYVYLLRNGTEIFKGDASSGRVNSTLSISAAISQTTDTGVAIYLDSPATTSAVTYKLQAWSGQWNEAGQPVYINRTASDRASTDYDQRVVSSITVLEVAA